MNLARLCRDVHRLLARLESVMPAGPRVSSTALPGSISRSRRPAASTCSAVFTSCRTIRAASCRFGLTTVTRLDQVPGERWGDQPLGVIRQDAAIHAAHLPFHEAQQPLLHLGGKCALVLLVDADHLLALRDDARLRRRPVVLGEQAVQADMARRQPGSSSPTTAASTACAASPATLAAVLAAPPGTKVRSCSSTTGTGASGEMRRTTPCRYSSSIASPTTSTRTRLSRASRRSCSAARLLMPSPSNPPAPQRGWGASSPPAHPGDDSRQQLRRGPVGRPPGGPGFAQAPNRFAGRCASASPGASLPG